MVIIAPEDLAGILGKNLDVMDCAGLKLTLGEVYRLESMGSLGIDTKKLPTYRPLEPKNNEYLLKPGPYLVKYNEYIEIPNGYIALAIQRSSLIRMGATLYTAVWDPGYRGRGSGLLVVHNPHGIIVERNSQIAQLVFIKMSRETRLLYRGSYLGEE